jgi:hypothetical protein
MPKKKKKYTDLEHVRQRYEFAVEAERDQRRLAVEDARFANAEDGQWDDISSDNRRDRPRFQINRISPVIDQLVGDQRQNRIGIKVIPQQEGTREIAEVIQGMVRSIEQQSAASDVYDLAFEEQITTGYGCWEIVSEYIEDSFEQELKIKPINSAATAVFFDPSAREYTKSDAKYAFKEVFLDDETFEELYPNANPVSFEEEDFSEGTQNNQWRQKDGIRVAEYWYKEPYMKKLALMESGITIDYDEDGAAAEEMGDSVVELREVESHQVKMIITNGEEILEGPYEWPGKNIPLIPVYGKETYVQDAKFTRGIVRFSKDPQRALNFAFSMILEAVSLAPKDPYIATTKNIAGYEDIWKTLNTVRPPVIPYTPDPINKGAPPSRAGAPAVQESLLSVMEQAKRGMHAVTGMEASSMGENVGLKSGKAIQAEQAKGDRGSYRYQSNLEKSLTYSGEQLIDLIPKFYDTDRIVRILGPEEKDEQVRINMTVVMADGEEVIINDLSMGRYGVLAVPGPAFATQQQETVAQLTTLAGENPMVAELAFDLIIKNMNLQGKEELLERVEKRMIEQKIIDPTEEQIKKYKLDQPKPPDPTQEALRKDVEATTQQRLADMDKTQAETALVVEKARNTAADTEKKVMDAVATSLAGVESTVAAMVAKIEAAIPVTQNDTQLVEGQQALALDSIGDAIDGAEIAGSMPAQAMR